MDDLLRIIGIPTAIPNSITKDIRFLLDVEKGDALSCVANYAIATQIASSLGTALDLLRAGLMAEGAVVPVNAMEIREVRVQKAMLGEAVIIELITTMGIPFVFQFPAQKAEAIADRLKTEAAKDRPAGRA